MPLNTVNIPTEPGVYLLKDKDGKVIYIGKAKSLKNRVRSYFVHSDSLKTNILTGKIKDIDYIITNSEIEALILEANLIKLHLPRYNIRLKDDKKYPYIKVTINEDFPRVFPTRDLRAGSPRHGGAIYFGPYTDVKSMKQALRTALKTFPVRTCKGEKLPRKVCLAYHLKKCYAPCENKITKAQYGKIIQGVIDFLAGKSAKIEHNLKDEMNDLSEKLEFEKAAQVRDRLRSIENIIKKQRVVFNQPIDMDIFGLQISGEPAQKTKACIVLLIIREGRIIGSEHYILQIQASATAGEIIRAFFLQYYKDAFFIPSQIVVRTIDEKDILEKWLSRKIIVPELEYPDKAVKGELTELITLAESNANFWLSTESRGKPILKSLLELQHTLQLHNFPRHIEAFDISNIGDKYAVGSCVSFIDGKPQKSGYRRFKIKSIAGIDDPKMMREIVERRIKYKNLPDLILVDGGITQVKAVREYVPQEIPVFGLAKKLEEIHTSSGEIICLPKTSPALRLLQRLRDEAHRFAISYHRKLRDKPKSLLAEIPGIGENRKKLLLKYFSSFEKLKIAGIEEIKKVPGIGEKYAQKIYSFLRSI